MSSQTDQQNPAESGGLVKVLAWYTLFYAVSLVGYMGGSQGLWYWYVTLRRPDWAPPGWSFTLIWTLLYGLIASASWLVKQSEKSPTRTAGLVLVGIQLVLSALWPWILFAKNSLQGAFIESTVLSLVVLATTIAYWKAKPSAGALMLTQLLWTLFTAILSLTLWRANI